MGKKITIVFGIIFLIFLILFLKYYFFGTYQNYNSKKIDYGFSVNNDILNIEVYNFDEWKSSLNFKYYFIENNIYIYSYAISRLLRNNTIDKIEIKLENKGIFNIYYKNKNNDKIFLKSIENK